MEINGIEWNKEKINELLMTQDKYIGRALVVLKARQTSAEQCTLSTHEHNNRGFTAYDAEPMTSMASFYETHGRLTAKQLAWLRGAKRDGTTGPCRLSKYWAQLIEEIKIKAEKKANAN